MRAFSMGFIIVEFIMGRSLSMENILFMLNDYFNFLINGFLKTEFNFGIHIFERVLL